MLSSRLGLLSQRTLSLSNQSMNITTVAVIGAGQMGSGIAQVSASSGFKVTLVDRDELMVDKALKSIENSVKKVAQKRFSNDESGQVDYCHSVLTNISTSTSLKKSVGKVDLVIESIVENLDVKRNLFKQIEEMSSTSTIFASNTSSLSLADISKDMRDKSRFGGLHFFNPVPVMKLLEVVRAEETSKKTFTSLLEYGHQLKKTVIRCKDTPGFVVNRLLIPYMIDAIRMAERGDASMEEIDIGMKTGANYKMGPFELCDYIGLDTMKSIMDAWQAQNPSNPQFAPSALLTKLVSEGKLGRKTGEGFFKYN